MANTAHWSSCSGTWRSAANPHWQVLHLSHYPKVAFSNPYANNGPLHLDRCAWLLRDCTTYHHQRPRELLPRAAPSLWFSLQSQGSLLRNKKPHSPSALHPRLRDRIAEKVHHRSHIQASFIVACFLKIGAHSSRCRSPYRLKICRLLIVDVLAWLPCLLFLVCSLLTCLPHTPDLACMPKIHLPIS